MQLSVRNYGAIATADIALDPIALVAARNSAGKTSLIAAVQAALTGQATPAGLTKKDAAVLVREGTESGSARAHTDHGEVGIIWPRCDVEAVGQKPPHATAVAAGLDSVLDRRGEERAKLLAGYVVTQPTVQDLHREMNGAGFGDKHIDATWTRITESGWDATYRAAADHATKTKGQWEQVTKEKWGIRKAAGWTPKGWTDDLDTVEIADLEQEVADTRGDVEGRIAFQAVSAERVVQLEAAVEAAEALDTTALQQALADAQSSLEKAQQTRAGLPPATNDPGLPCPHCGAFVVVEAVGPQHGHYQIKPVEVEPLSSAETDARRERIASADGRVEHFRGAVYDADRALRDAGDRRNKARHAQDELDQARAQGTAGGTGTTAEQVEHARAMAAEAVVRRDRKAAKANADRINATIVRTLRLVDILAPEGLRLRKSAAAIEPFNADLAERCAAAGWQPVRLDGGFGVHYGARPIARASESERFRARVTLQVAMAVIDKSDVVIIDRADLLDQAGRNGLFKLLRHAGLKALVAMTMNRPDLTPDLSKAGLGVTYWIDAGDVSPVGAVEQRAA
jgi:hypothetical protein